MAAFAASTGGESVDSCFLVAVRGQVVSAVFVDRDSLYCRYSFHHGSDWKHITGLNDAVSQVARRSIDGDRQHLVWNLPLDATFKSTNPHGWPQLVLSCYGPDLFGNDVVRGYGVCHLPITPGFHRIRVPLFVPCSASLFQRLTSWFSGRRPELVDPLTVLAAAQGREVIRVQSEGYIECEVDVVFKDLQRLGYCYQSSVGKSRDLVSGRDLGVTATSTNA